MSKRSQPSLSSPLLEIGYVISGVDLHLVSWLETTKLMVLQVQLSVHANSETNSAWIFRSVLICSYQVEADWALDHPSMETPVFPTKDTSKMVSRVCPTYHIFISS